MTAPRRPRLVAWSVLAVAVLAALALVAGFRTWATATTDTAGEVAFTRPLTIPPLAESTVDAQGRRVFDLHLRTGRTDLGRRPLTDTWGINGSYLGPTLRAARGEQVVVNVTNEVRETTTVHWHGMHLPARMDGGPHQPILPGGTWSPSWRIDQPAATLWYHPHLHGTTALHVYRGLAGMFLLDDPAAGGLELPDDYGVDDLPVIVQDKSFTSDGQLDEADTPFSPTGLLGDMILVNGTPGPYHLVRTERVRLRLLNASNARIYNFGFADDRTFAVIGSDGGLLAVPHPTSRIQLSPGERAEIVVTLRPGETTVLRSYPADLRVGALSERLAGGDDRLDVLQLRAAGRLAPSAEIPSRLVDLPAPTAEGTATTRHFSLGGDADINGRRMDMTRIDERVPVGATEIWEVGNRGGQPHNFHIHGVQFRVLAVDGRRPPPEFAGWKDTVYVGDGQTVRLVVRFPDHADAQVPYMLHCHLLRHEDQGMMLQFVVVPPGRHSQQPPQDHHHS